MERDGNYERICKLALTAESIVIYKDLSEDKSITAVTAGINHPENEQDKALSQQKIEI